MSGAGRRFSTWSRAFSYQSSRKGILQRVSGDAGTPVRRLCPTHGEPWQRSGIEVKLTKPLPSKTADKPKPSTSESRFPWSMQTFSGIKCVALTGTVPVLHHLPGVYGCSNGEYLWGGAVTKAGAVDDLHSPEHRQEARPQGKDQGRLVLGDVNRWACTQARVFGVCRRRPGMFAPARAVRTAG